MSSNTNIRKWNEAVDKAKALGTAAKEHQMEIARLALSVCEITHGGARKNSAAEGKCTIFRFAKEAGVNECTLSNWIAIRKLVFERLPLAVKRQATYTEMMSVSRKINKSTLPSEVLRLYNDYKSMDSFDHKIIRYMNDLRSLHYNFENQAAALKCDDSTLREILFFSQKIISNIRSNRPNIVPKLSGVTHRYRGSAALAVLGARK